MGWMDCRLFPSDKFSREFKVSMGASFVAWACFYGIRINWFDITRPFQIIMFGVAFAGGIWILLCRWKGKSAEQSHLCITVWAVFAFLMTLKTILNVRITHYGFVTAMPATLLFVYLLIEWLPKELRKLNGSGHFFRFGMMIWLVVSVLSFLKVSDRYYRIKSFPFGTIRETLYDYHPKIVPEGLLMSAALGELSKYKDQDDTFCALPDGILLNYMLRTPNPSPFYALNPMNIHIYGGESRVLEVLQDDPPDLILIFKKDLSEYGARYFGKDYAKQIMQWILEDYENVRTLETSDGEFGFKIFRKSVSVSSV